jgi:methionyl-tRNA formyltransferase
MSLPRIVFAGTPDFSVACLEALLDQAIEIVGVYTQPDRSAGRGKKLQQSPVKQCALKAGLDVYQPESFKAGTNRETLAGLHPDLMVVVAYGLILPQSVLDIPKLGCINIHASLLPRWRGAAPIQRAIEAGDTQSGVCLMQMEKGLDSGPVLAKSSHDIPPQETGGQLHDALSQMGADLLRENLHNILNQRLTPVRQPEQGLRYAHKLSKQEARVQWQMDAIDIANKVRAFNPWPVMSSCINGQVLRIHQATAEAADEGDNSQAGEIIEASANGICVGTGSGRLNITRLQKPGGKILDARDFLNGFSLESGQRFERD